MLSDEDIAWLIAVARQRLRNVHEPRVGNAIRDRLVKIEKKFEQPVPVAPVEPLELLIFCPVCKTQHIDVGEFATTPHKRHACQGCGLLFSVTKDVPNIGVRFFKGCRDQGSWTAFKESPDVKLGATTGPATISPGSLLPGQELVARLGDYVVVYKGPVL